MRSFYQKKYPSILQVNLKISMRTEKTFIIPCISGNLSIVCMSEELVPTSLMAEGFICDGCRTCLFVCL